MISQFEEFYGMIDRMAEEIKEHHNYIILNDISAKFVKVLWLLRYDRPKNAIQRKNMKNKLLKGIR
jgi:hypothetical protein